MALHVNMCRGLNNYIISRILARMAQNRSQNTRKTTQTSLTILDAVNEVDGGTLTEVAEHTELAPSTVHTHLRTLENSEYVICLDGEYHLGMKLFNLGESARMRDTRYRFARQVAAELSEKVSEEVNFSIEEYGRSIVLFDEMRTSGTEEFQVGRYFHMHSSASGKAMLAEYSKDRVDEILEHRGLPKHTPHTITDIDELFGELDRIRSQGYAVNRQEELEGLRAIAMVVHAPDGSVFGTLDISGPAYRLPDNENIAAQLQPYVTDLETTLKKHEQEPTRRPDG